MKFTRGLDTFWYIDEYSACYEAVRREDYTLRIRNPITRAPGINSTPVIRALRVQFEEEPWCREIGRDREREREENIIFRGLPGHETRLIKVFCKLTVSGGCHSPA